MNELISQNQTGLKPHDSCINQLISFTHEIYQSFYDVLEVGGVFLDTSKAFDNVKNEGLIHKLKLNEVKDYLQDTWTKLYQLEYEIGVWSSRLTN